MKKTALAAILAAFVAAPSAAANKTSLEVLLDTCSKGLENHPEYSYWAQGYCEGMLDSTAFLWDATHMAKQTPICRKGWGRESLPEVVAYLAQMQRGAELLAMGDNIPQASEAEARENLIAMGSLPPRWNAAPPQYLLAHAYTQVVKCQ